MEIDNLQEGCRYKVKEGSGFSHQGKDGLCLRIIRLINGSVTGVDLQHLDGYTFIYLIHQLELVMDGK